MKLHDMNSFKFIIDEVDAVHLEKCLKLLVILLLGQMIREK